MGRSAFRLLLFVPPALAVGLLFLGDSSAGIEPDSTVQLASASAPKVELTSAAHDILPANYDLIGLSDGPKYVGAAGCAAANCHGGNGLQGVQGSEHSIWIQKDPHAGAYDVLLNNQSKHIIKLLKSSPRYEKMLANREAHQTRLCLDCHSVAPHESRLAHGHKFSMTDGVSCEGCHGPAEKWLDPHKRPDWEDIKKAYGKEKLASELGFYDTETLSTRARVCAECHIGSGDKEVNHDLMAAGHPRLTFEMSAYFDNLPAHWDVHTEEAMHPNLDVKLWAHGQLAVAERTCELLEKRASDPYKVWPEFTETGCYACHHNLQPSSWRQERGFGTRRPGGYPWGTWQFPVLEMITPQLLPGEANPFLKEDGAYRQLQNVMSRPIPNKGEVQEHTKVLMDELRELSDALEEKSYSEEEIRSLLQAVTGSEGQNLVGRNWDAAAQVYLAAVALYQGLADAKGGSVLSDDEPIYEHFRAIRDLLKFPEETKDSGEKAIYNSPKTFEETAPNPVDGIKSQLDGINQAVKP
jgi:hypothetical protein